MLIRKDFKQAKTGTFAGSGLRVLLIRKDFKLTDINIRTKSTFESLVNTEGFQTGFLHVFVLIVV